MSYAKQLRSSANSWSVAYISFQTGRLREGFRAYVFVEDEDDKQFYNRALTEYDSLCFLGCGGRSGVLRLYKRLLTDGNDGGNLFFIDRDTEIGPYEFPDAVCRTKYYSWETHVCHPEFVGWFLQRRIDPNPEPKDRNNIERGWKATIEAFTPVLDKHTALCRTAFVLGVSLGMSDITVARGAIDEGGVIKPSAEADGWHRRKVELALENGASEEEVAERMTRYAQLDTFETCQGKLLFSILREYVRVTLARLERIIRGEYNSPKAWLSDMPWNHPELDYIRHYARARIGEP